MTSTEQTEENITAAGPSVDELIERCACVCHEANRAYCATIGDVSQPSWENAPEWQKTSAQNGIRFHVDHPDAKPSDSHENWLREKIADGWIWGPDKDPDKKEHPCCCPYDDLPMSQRVKDSLFMAVANVFIPVIRRLQEFLATPTTYIDV
jgi:hypothetical protein